MADQVKSGGFMSWYFDSNLLLRIFIGLILGAIVGVFLAFTPEYTPGFVSYTKFFGDLFIRLLKMIVVPVIFFSLITGASSITPHQLGRIGVKVMAYYILTSVFAIIIALVLANLLSPGAGLGIVGDLGVEVKLRTAPPISEVFLAIVPTNPIESLVKGDVLPIIFFALVFGIALAILRDSSNETISRNADNLHHVFSALAETMYKVVHGVMQYAPIGVFVLIAIVFAQQGPKVIGPLIFATVVVYLGLVLHVVICYGGILALFRLSLVKFIKRVQEPAITAFVTRSSSATLPISLQVSEEEMGVPRSVSSFSLPIGATVNMDGTAIYLAVGATFIANAIGMPLGIDQQITLLIVATLGAIGAAGVPGAGAIMMLMVLDSVGLKVEAGSAVAAAYAMILGIDALFDMGRTCINVTGDIAGAAVVSANEGSLDRSKWQD